MSASRSENSGVVVIGTGPAGYVCAIRLAQLGQKVTVIEKAKPGGVCLNVGCIPSKALIYAGTLVEKMQHASEIGIEVSKPKIDMKKLQAWKETVVKKLTGGVSGLLKANGCTYIQGEARFVSPTSIEVTTEKGKSTIGFDKCVIATGSRPTEIPGMEVDQKTVLDSTGALALNEIPKTMLCVGGGYIGLELGTFFAKIGVKVTVVEAASGILSGVDPALAQVVDKGLKKRGVEVLKNTKVKKIAKSGSGAKVTFEGDKSGDSQFDEVLVTIGRVPNTDKLDLEKAGLKTDSKGFLNVGPTRQTDVPNIYAIGDVAGQPLLAHKGSKEGIIAAEAISGLRSVYDVAAIPAVIFTDPEIATAGITEQEAKEQQIDYMVGQFPFAANGRALSVQEPDGFVKLIGEKKTGKLLGVHIVGCEASNLIGEAILALEMGATIEDLALTVHAHPTLPETLMEAAEATLGHAIHIFQRQPKPKPSPEASP